MSDDFEFSGTDPDWTVSRNPDFTAHILDDTGSIYDGLGTPNSIAIYWTSTDSGDVNYSYTSTTYFNPSITLQ
jgi:hypothetical protein